MHLLRPDPPVHAAIHRIAGRPRPPAIIPSRVASHFVYCSLSFAFQVSNGEAPSAAAAEAAAYDDDDIDEELEKVAMAVEEEVAAAAAAAANSTDNHDNDNR